MSSTFSFMDKETKVKLKGRCTRCWGHLLARREDSGSWTGIRCRVCGIKIEGDKAQDEFKKMQHRTALNLMNMKFRRAPDYGDAMFAQKIFPQPDTLSEKQLAARVRTKLSEHRKRNRLSRHDFPPGSPGLLFIQAHILTAGLTPVSYPDDLSVADIPVSRVMDDRSVAVPLSLEGFRGDPDYSSNRLRNRMGTTMIEAMTAAFACELAMKAICPTCADEAPKSQDLMKLHDALPLFSKR